VGLQWTFPFFFPSLLSPSFFSRSFNFIMLKAHLRSFHLIFLALEKVVWCVTKPFNLVRLWRDSHWRILASILFFPPLFIFIKRVRNQEKKNKNTMKKVAGCGCIYL
jgi:hypothetical protein